MEHSSMKNLKDVGWPQNTEDLLTIVIYNGKEYAKFTEPTVSELIEAWGIELNKIDHTTKQQKWVAIKVWTICRTLFIYFDREPYVL